MNIVEELKEKLCEIEQIAQLLDEILEEYELDCELEDALTEVQKRIWNLL